MKYQFAAVLLLFATLASAQTAEKKGKKPSGPQFPLNVTTSLGEDVIGTLEIQVDDQPAGVVPAVVRARGNGELVLVEYRNGFMGQRFRCSLASLKKIAGAQAILAVGDDKNGFDDVLAGVVLMSKSGVELRFDQRIRIPNGKMAASAAMGPTRGFVEILFDSNPAGASLTVLPSQVAATTPATLSLKYHRNETMRAFVKRDGAFDALITLKFETDSNNVDWLVTGDGRYRIPASPTAPITRVIALFEPIVR